MKVQFKDMGAQELTSRSPPLKKKIIFHWSSG